MRSDQDILELIVNRAQRDNHIRAVLLNGSRADPQATRDVFQDFDVAYFVDELAAFTTDHRWIDCFGERIILQMPEAMGDPPPAGNGTFAYLMQFKDGHRIDLTLIPATEAHSYVDGPGIILLDKDGILPQDAAALSRHPRAVPSLQAFSDCCNEFWWMCLNVAKGLWREEIVYARHMYHQIHRDQVLKMLIWFVRIQDPQGCDPGKFGRHIHRCLKPRERELLLATYADADIDRNWQSLEALCTLFGETGRQVGAHFGYPYPVNEEEGVKARLQQIRALCGTTSEPLQTGK